MRLLPRLATAACLTLPACAQLTSSARQTVQMRADPSGATYVVRTLTGDSVAAGRTPDAVALRRGDRYLVEFVAPGRGSESLPLERGLNGWVWGNLLLGGLPGLAVDFSTGAAYALAPTTLDARLSAEATAPIASPTVTPCYPRLAALARAEGHLIYELAIDSAGQVAAVRFTRSGHAMLRAAVETWAAGASFPEARGTTITRETLFLFAPRRPADCSR